MVWLSPFGTVRSRTGLPATVQATCTAHADYNVQCLGQPGLKEAITREAPVPMQNSLARYTFRTS